MTDLTQDWKDGKLKEGFYYVQFPSGIVGMYGTYGLCRYRLTADGDKIKILAEVPDYNLWLNVLNTAEVERNRYTGKANN